MGQAYHAYKYGATIYLTFYLFYRPQDGKKVIVVRNVMLHSSGMLERFGKVKQWVYDRWEWSNNIGKNNGCTTGESDRKI